MPEQRALLTLAKLRVQLQLEPGDVVEAAEVDVVRARVERAAHDRQVEPIVDAVDADRAPLERCGHGARGRSVDPLLPVQASVPPNERSAPALEEAGDVPSDRAGCADDRDQGCERLDGVSVGSRRQMSIREQTGSEAVIAARERYVARGISTPPLVVARAEGARIEDVDGRSYIDFAGGLGCQNTGHGFAAAAIHEQTDRYLHQCFMVGIYEPYVEVCRLLAELSPCHGPEQRSLLVSTGAEAVENAVKIARAATGRPGRARLRARLPRPDAADDDDDEQGRPVQARFRSLRARDLPSTGAVSLSRRLLGRCPRSGRAPVQRGRRPADACLRGDRARSGRGRLHPAPAGLPEAPAGAAPPPRDPPRRRRGPERNRADRDRVGDRAVRASSPTCWSRRSRSAAGCRSAPSPDRPRSWTPSSRAVSAGRSAATRSPVRRRSPFSRRSGVRSSWRAHASWARRSAPGSSSWRRGSPRSARSAASGRCSRSS